MPRHRAAAIVIHDDQLLVMYRKNTKEFYVFPGGAIQSGETNEQAVVREIMEEASLEVRVERQVYELHHDNGDIHYYFLCRYLSGTPAIQVGTNEYNDNELGHEMHEPRWEPLEGVSTITLYPLEVRDQLITDLRNGFSDQIVTFDLPALV